MISSQDGGALTSFSSSKKCFISSVDILVDGLTSFLLLWTMVGSEWYHWSHDRYPVVICSLIEYT